MKMSVPGNAYIIAAHTDPFFAWDRSAKLVPDLRALCATAKQHLSGVADFYYKLGRHREREYDCRRKKHRLIHTLARKSPLLGRREEGKWLKTICGGAKSNGIMRGKPHSLFGAGKERQAAPSRETIWRKIDFQTGLPQETQGTSKRRPWRSWSGRGGSRTNFLSLLRSLPL